MKSAGIIPIYVFAGITKVLMLRSYDHWDFPKGLVEDGEIEIESAIRELKEETGLENPEFLWGKDSYETEPYGKNGKTASYYAARVSNANIVLPVNEELGKPEHDEFRWVSFDEIKGMYIKPRILRVIIWVEDLVFNKWKV